MRIAEQLSEEDLGEPPSLGLPQIHYYGLLKEHDSLKIYPPYPHYISKTREFECSMLDDFVHIEIKASISGDLVETYNYLSVRKRFTLEEKIAKSMGRFALSAEERAIKRVATDDSTVLINNVPVIFEPLNQALLVGYWVDEEALFTDDEVKAREAWDGWQKKKMHIKSLYIESYDQQRLLLSGLATFVSYLEQQNNKRLLIP